MRKTKIPNHLAGLRRGRGRPVSRPRSPGASTARRDVGRPDAEPAPTEPAPTKNAPTALEGVACDIDGVLRVGRDLIPGAAETFRTLVAEGVPHVLVSNTTMADAAMVATQLRVAGLPIEPDDVSTVGTATAAYVRRHHPGRRCLLISAGMPFTEADGLELVDADPDVVIFGGAGDTFDHRTLNRAFTAIMGGADFVAMHRNRCWQTPEGLALDAGPFISALEQATGRTATVIGKPSPEFFGAALDRKRLKPTQVVMVGDDLDSDVLAAQSLGMHGVLARTGKFRPDVLHGAAGTPDQVINSIADLPALLRNLGVLS